MNIVILLVVLLLCAAVILVTFREKNEALLSATGTSNRIELNFDKNQRKNQVNGTYETIGDVNTSDDFAQKCLGACLFNPNCTSVVRNSGQGKCFLKTTTAMDMSDDDSTDTWVKKNVAVPSGDGWFNKSGYGISKAGNLFSGADQAKNNDGTSMTAISEGITTQALARQKCLPACAASRNCYAVEWEKPGCNFYDKLKYGTTSLEPKSNTITYVKDNFVRHTGEDRWGGDIASATNVTRDYCVNRCNRNSLCIGFSMKDKTCILKNTNAKPLDSNDGWEFFEKVGAETMNPLDIQNVDGYTVHKDGDPVGARQLGPASTITVDPTQRDGDGWSTCMAKCTDNPHCRVAVINKDGNQCYLKDGKDHHATGRDRSGWMTLIKKDWKDFTSWTGVSSPPGVPGALNPEGTTTGWEFTTKQGDSYQRCDDVCNSKENCAGYVTNTSADHGCWMVDRRKTIPVVNGDASAVMRLKPGYAIRRGKVVPL